LTAGQFVMAVPLDGGDDAALFEVPAVGQRGGKYFAATVLRDAGGDGQFRALEILLGDQVDHASDRVGAVDRGRAVLHDFRALQHGGRDDVQVECTDCTAGA